MRSQLEAHAALSKIATKAAALHAERLAAIIEMAQRQRDEPLGAMSPGKLAMRQICALHNLILGDGFSPNGRAGE
jgi:hypothetical protein